MQFLTFQKSALTINPLDPDSIFTKAAAAAKSDLDQNFDIPLRKITRITLRVQASKSVHGLLMKEA